jgi:hypothetical protein
MQTNQRLRQTWIEPWYLVYALIGLVMAGLLTHPDFRIGLLITAAFSIDAATRIVSSGQSMTPGRHRIIQ